MDGNMDSPLPIIQIDNYSDDNNNDHEPDNGDQYSAGIDLLNACREFYVSRKETVTKVKKQYEFCNCARKDTQGDQIKSFPNDLVGEENASSETSENKNISKLTCPKCTYMWNNFKNEKNKKSYDKRMDIEQTMSVLRYEMASLIEQDLDIMKKLLQLNERIEQFKWHCKLYPCTSVSNSSMDSCLDPHHQSDRSISSCHSLNISSRSIPDVEPNQSSCFYDRYRKMDKSLTTDTNVSGETTCSQTIELPSILSDDIYKSDSSNDDICADLLINKKKHFDTFLTEDDISSSSMRKDSSTDVESYDSGFNEPLPTNDSPL